MHFYLYEDCFVLKQITKERSNILDVGCGQGRYLMPLSKSHTVVGIDINRDTVNELNSKGLKVLHADEIAQIDIRFDYIIMSHIIEHLLPLQMLETVDGYLELLKDGGELIIATPLLYNEFYDDFDHLKPYTAKSISMLFSDFPQHQKKPLNRLSLRKVWFRKWPFEFFYFQCDPFVTRLTKYVVNKLLWAVFLISNKTIARTTGWVGVFVKQAARRAV